MYKEKTKDEMLAFQTGFTLIHEAGKAHRASERPHLAMQSIARCGVLNNNRK